MQHIFEFGYNPPRTMGRAEYKAIHKYFRTARRKVESKVNIEKIHRYVKDTLIYGTGAMQVDS